MTIEDIIDRLYGMPPAEFTRARDDAVRELRQSGQRDTAEQVKALRKPTAAAGAVNRLVREHRRDVERFLGAAAALREAQFSGTGDVASATRQEHEALEELVSVGGEPVRETLLAAAVDDDAAQQLLEARLERPLEPRGFGTLLAHLPPSAARGTTTAAAEAKRPPPERDRPPPERDRPGDTAVRSRLKEAKAALSAAQADERRAREHWDQAQRVLEKARAAVEQAQRDVDRVHGA